MHWFKKKKNLNYSTVLVNNYNTINYNTSQAIKGFETLQQKSRVGNKLGMKTITYKMTILQFPQYNRDK